MAAMVMAVLIPLLRRGTIIEVAIRMVMAVPMTAVLRIFLKNVAHPLPRWVAEVMGALEGWETGGRFTPIIEQVKAHPELTWIVQSMN